MNEFDTFYHVEPNIITQQQCEEIIKQSERDWTDRSTTCDTGLRLSVVTWLYNDSDTWIYELICPKIEAIKERIWPEMNLQVLDGMQYTLYYPHGGRYGWHVDLMEDTEQEESHRALSYSIILQDSDCFSGGDFKISKTIETKTVVNYVPKQETITDLGHLTAGSIVMFPSIIPHMISPVTDNHRRSLVGWYEGNFGINKIYET